MAQQWAALCLVCRPFRRSSSATVSRNPQPQKIRPIPAILLFSAGGALWYSRAQPGGDPIREPWEGGMILAALVGLSLVSSTSFDPHLTAPTGLAAIEPGAQT